MLRTIPIYDVERRRQVVTDARGHETVVEVEIEGADETTTVRQAGVTNAQVTMETFRDEAARTADSGQPTVDSAGANRVRPT
ncbi:MAG: hypothetical protein ACI4QJ_08295 [Candidatus Spyradenecus sp.]